MSSSFCFSILLLFFFFNDTATTEIYTLSLHDALPINSRPPALLLLRRAKGGRTAGDAVNECLDSRDLVVPSDCPDRRGLRRHSKRFRSSVGPGRGRIGIPPIRPRSETPSLAHVST